MVTLVISILQLYGEYRRDLTEINTTFTQIEHVNLKTLTHTLWVADSEELQLQVDGILRLPEMKYIEIRDEAKVWASAGTNSFENTLTRTYPMIRSYMGKKYLIGTLQVVASLDQVYSRLARQALIIVVSNGVKTFLVAGFIVYIFQHLITRHLVKIAEFLESHDVSAFDKKLELDRHEMAGHETDELGVVVSAINNMQSNLKQSFRMLKENEGLLLRHKTELEDLVKERTTSLEAAQETLVRKERLATLGQLTATVSHELRNPLNAMHPSLYVIRKETDPKNRNLLDSIDRIERNLKRCDKIIDELLDYTRITSLELTGNNLDTWLADTIDEIGIDERIVVKENLNLAGIEIQFDSGRLRRAVINIVENACQAMLGSGSKDERGSVGLLEIKTYKNDRGINIVISDNGPGIEQEVREKMFEPLYSTKSFGVGLGMSTVKQIMELHRGGVDVESEIGKGTSVTLWLRL